MPLIVGNLLTDPAAQSFISLADAEAYLQPEAAGAPETSPLTLWMGLRAAEQEATLVRASRWLAAAYSWNTLRDGDLARVGHVAARLAAETVNRSIYGGVEAASVVASESVGVGSIRESITYREGVKADVAGLALPWLKDALRGLIRTGATTFVRRA